MALLTLVLGPVQKLAIWRGWRVQNHIPLFYHRLFRRLVGLKVVVSGQPCRVAPVLFVANHASWLDIPALAGLVRASFVARDDLAGWGVFGMLARLQRTVFIDRERRVRAGAHFDQMLARLSAGDNLILFPEGTSNDGNRVLAFKTSLFALAERWRRIHDGAAPLHVQPVSLAYTALDGVPLSRRRRPLVAFYGDMELGPHFWQVLRHGRITVRVHFHPPVTAQAFKTRKTLAAHCRREIAGGLGAALHGLPPAS